MKTPPARADSAAVAEAVLTVPGVACLRPGLRGLLYAPGPRPPAARGSGTGSSAVRVTLGTDGSVAALRVEVVVRARHRAADVARAVREAAAEAAAAPAAAVRVVVTGIV
ncbi:Asp23/Gls24 family envelope stress response protein [Streptomyces sp. NPDC048507]|uniref:Asp23/Gls24 family envelope stress response protein n=1 Tax=Streptomyces sp. NPDC048507 TaxID=3365560 RepID=UPI00371C4884